MAISRIAFTFDAGSWAVLKALLESEGIGVLDLARGAHVAIAGVDQGYYLQVADDDEIRARRLLREHGFGKYLVDSADPA